MRILKRLRQWLFLESNDSSARPGALPLEPVAPSRAGRLTPKAAHKSTRKKVAKKAAKKKRSARKTGPRPLTKSGALRQVGWLGLTERDYDRMHAKLAKQWKKEPSPADTAWSLLNGAVTCTRDLGELKSIFLTMALFLHREGRDSYEMVRKATELELRNYEQTGVVKKVRIIANLGCDVCRRQDGKLLTIRQALKTMPLPCKDCNTKLYDLEAKFGYCRCSYEAELD